MTYLGYGTNPVLDLLSSFWTTVYESKEFVDRLTAGYGENFSDAYFNFIETVLGNSIQDIPVFDRKKWFFLELNESENLGFQQLVYKDKGIVYGPQIPPTKFIAGKSYNYGGNFSTDSLFSWKLPGNMVDVDKFIMNRVSMPSMVLIKGSDFFIENETITFKNNPFDNNYFPTRDIFDSDGNIVDRTVGMWVLNSFWDYDYVWRNYGYLVDFNRKSSEEYRLFVESLWKLFSVGPSYKNIVAGINAVLGIPISKDDEELLDLEVKDDFNVLVTNKNNYFIHKSIPIRSDIVSNNSTPFKGKRLGKLEPLTDTVKLYDNKSNPGWWRNISPLIIPGNLTISGNPVILPDNITIHADVYVGAKWEIPESVYVRDDSFRKVGMYVGGFVIGADPYNTKVDYKNFVFSSLFANNIFYLEIHPSVTLLSNFNKDILGVILSSTPAYCSFINYSFLDSLNDYFEIDELYQYNYDTSVGNSFLGNKFRIGHNTLQEELFVGEGLELSDEADSSESPGYDPSVSLGYDEGYFGFPTVGFSNVSGFTVGTFGFNSGILVRSIV